MLLFKSSEPAICFLGNIPTFTSASYLFSLLCLVYTKPASSTVPSSAPNSLGAELGEEIQHVWYGKSWPTLLCTNSVLKTSSTPAPSFCSLSRLSSFCSTFYPPQFSIRHISKCHLIYFCPDSVLCPFHLSTLYFGQSCCPLYLFLLFPNFYVLSVPLWVPDSSVSASPLLLSLCLSDK